VEWKEYGVYSTSVWSMKKSVLSAKITVMEYRGDEVHDKKKIERIRELIEQWYVDFDGGIDSDFDTLIEIENVIDGE